MLPKSRVSASLLFAAVTLALPLVTTGSVFAGVWPTHSIRMIVPFAAGGGADILGRVIASNMSKALGRPVIVENMGGAGGMIGSTRAARAPPDGYTVLLGSRSDAIDMTLYKHPTFNLETDLEPVGLIAEQPTILVARKDLPATSLQQFITYLKKNAATVKLGSAGIGATGYVDCATFDKMIGVNIEAIPYRGSGPAMQDLIAGRFDYFCTISGSATGPLQNGLVKGIAVFRHERLPVLPTVPTAYEQGMDYDAAGWFALFLPRGTPSRIVRKFHDAASAAIDLRSVQEQLAADGTYVVQPKHRSAEYLKSILGTEIEKNGEPIRAAGIFVE